MEGTKEDQMTGCVTSTIAEVVQSSIVIDPVGDQYEENVFDSSRRREPILCDIDSESDSESTASSSSVSSLSISSLDENKDDEEAKKKKTAKYVKTKGELRLEDLPPIKDLKIAVPENDIRKIGMVYNVVDQLVVVESFQSSSPLDVDSALFLSCGKPLGLIFEVFGPVKQPYYVVRFNSNEEIVEKGIAQGAEIYYAPSHADITNYIFTDALMRQKGSDASWEHNNEPPEEHLDYSDDEKERAARKKRSAKNHRRTRDEQEKSYSSCTARSITSTITDCPSTGYGLHQHGKSCATVSKYSSGSNILKPPAKLTFHAHQVAKYSPAQQSPPWRTFHQRLPLADAFRQPPPVVKSFSHPTLPMEIGKQRQPSMQPFIQISSAEGKLNQGPPLVGIFNNRLHYAQTYNQPGPSVDEMNNQRPPQVDIFYQKTAPMERAIFNAFNQNPDYRSPFELR